MEFITRFLMLALFTGTCFGGNLFDTNTGLLYIPSITVDNSSVFDASLKRIGPQQFELQSYSLLDLSDDLKDSYNTSTGVAELSSLEYKGHKYRLQLTHQGNLIYKITDISEIDSQPPVEPIDPNLLQGVFAITSGGGTPNASNRKLENVLQSPFIDGVTLRSSWGQIQPTFDAYDFSDLDEKVAMIESYGRKVKIILLGGSLSPEWLYDELGVPYIDLIDRNGGSQPVKNPAYWSEIYLDAYRDFVKTVFEHFNDNPNIVGIIIGGPSVKTAEMHMSSEWQLCDNPEQPESETCITEARWMYAWQQSLDAFAKHSKIHYGIAIHSTQLFGDTATEAVIDYAIAGSGDSNRFFMQWNGFHKLATFDDFEYKTMHSTYIEGMERGFQVNVTCQKSQGSTCDFEAGDLLSNYEKAIQEANIDFVEVLSDHILAPDLANDVEQGYQLFHP